MTIKIIATVLKPEPPPAAPAAAAGGNKSEPVNDCDSEKKLVGWKTELGDGEV